MNVNLKFYIIYAVLYGLILLIGEGSYRILRVKPAWSRNFSHLSAGLVSLPYPWIFSSHWWVLLLAVQSSLVLLLTRNLNLLPSHHLSGSRSAGSYLFFASLYLCFLVSSLMHNPFFFLLPILVLSASDVFASVVGRTLGNPPKGKWGRILKDDKSLAGTLAFFFSSLITVTLAYSFYLQADFSYAFGMALVISLAAALVEAISSRGYDNFFIPAIILFIMLLEVLL
jgi:dolichol kinase